MEDNNQPQLESRFDKLREFYSASEFTKRSIEDGLDDLIATVSEGQSTEILSADFIRKHYGDIKANFDSSIAIQIRKELGESKTDVAVICGLSPSSAQCIDNYERGVLTQKPSERVIKYIQWLGNNGYQFLQ